MKMNLNDLYTELLNQVQNTGEINLNDSVLGTNGNIQTYLLRSNIIIITTASQITLNTGTQTLTIVGTVPLDRTNSFLNLQGQPVNWVFTNDSTQFNLAVGPLKTLYLQPQRQKTSQLSAPTDWSLGISFPLLYGSDVSSLPYNDPYPILSFMNLWGTVPQSGLFFNAGFDASQVPMLNTLSTFLRVTLPTLTFTGTILPRLYTLGGYEWDIPDIDIKASLGISDLEIADFLNITDPYIGARTTYVIQDQNDPNNGFISTQVYFGSQITIGDESNTQVALNLEAQLSSSFDMIRLSAFSPIDSTIQTNITNIANTLFPNKDSNGWTESIPTELTSLMDVFGFKYFSTDITLSATPTIMSIQIGVGSLSPYTFKLNGEDLNLTFDFTFLIIAPLRTNRYASGTFAGVLTYKTYTFTVGFSVPNFVITGSFQGTLNTNVAQLCQGLGISVPIPEDLLTFSLSALSISADLSNNSLSFYASAELDFHLFGSEILAIREGQFAFTIDVSGNTTQVTGTIQGILSILGLDLSISANLSNNATNPTTLEIHLLDKTLGDLVQFLVHIVDPNLDFTFDAPWDFLNTISLDALVLYIDITNRQIRLSYNANLDLRFMTITQLGLVYARNAQTGESSINIEFQGTFLGQTMGPGQQRPALGWDLLNGSPPAVPGQGSRLFELDYLGLGQHITFTNRSLTTVSGAITALQQDFLPVSSTNTNPLVGNSALTFSAESSWLIGTKFSVMNTVFLSAVFNDPNLYGLLVSLAGEKASIFAGLRFEIVYRKVSESLGVYSIELRVPDAMRQLEFGAVSVTLPIIKLDVYTNQNFRIDLGFPQGADYSRSFSVQVFPFVGYGGLYFALLNGQTSSRVPRITNGTFSPVIEAGLALSIGVGKSIRKGPLSAELSVRVTGRLEGVLGWFNPTDQGQASDRYYWVQGTIGIIGTVYGAVDFVVIKASVSIIAQAAATIVVAAYEPIEVALSVSVSAEASVDVWFTVIHYTFQVDVNESFTIGSRSTPPWIVDSNASSNVRLRQQDFYPYHKRRDLESQKIRFLPAAISWAPVNVFNGTIETLNLMLLPVFTATDNPSPNSDPQILGNLMLMAKSDTDPQAKTPKDILRVTDGESPFTLLMDGLMGWAINTATAGTGSTVSATQLQNVYNSLSDPTVIETYFNYENITAFIAANYTVLITSYPENLSDTTSVSSAIIPIIPELSYTTSFNGTPIQTVDFAAYNIVDSAYQDRVNRYVEEMTINYQDTIAQNPFSSETNSSQPQTIPSVSIAQLMFNDSVVMMMKSAVQAALNFLENYQYTNLDASLAQIASSFPVEPFKYIVTARDTFESFHRNFSIRPNRLRSLNSSLQNTQKFAPGTPINMESGVSVLDIALANQEHLLREGTQVPLGGLLYQVQDGESFASIAETHTFPSALGIAQANTDNNLILNPSSQLTIPQGVILYMVEEGDTYESIAAFVLIRSQGIGSIPDLSLMQETIQSLNPEVSFDPLPTGTVLEIPYLYTTPMPTFTYTSKQGDTLELIAAYFSAIQNQTLDWTDFINAFYTLNPVLTVGQAVTVPPIDYSIRLYDTLNQIATLLNLASVDSLLSSDNLASTSLLVPLSILTIPDFTYTLKADDTLLSLASQYDLTVETLVSSSNFQNTQNLFSNETVPLSVPNVPLYDQATLRTDLVQSGKFNTIASLTSRFLMHGLKLPDPQSSSDSNLLPLYDLTGQQFVAPSTLSPTDVFDIVVTKNPNCSWITFVDSIALKEKTTLKSIDNQYPKAHAYNRFLNTKSKLSKGTILYTEIASELTISITQSILNQYPYPSTTLNPGVTGPELLPNYHDEVKNYTFTQSLHWQINQPLILDPNVSEPLISQPSLWFLSSSLSSVIAEQTISQSAPYDLFYASKENTSLVDAQLVSQCAWATAVPFIIKRVRLSGNESVSYLIQGTETTYYRNCLQNLWLYLNQTSTDQTTLFLLYNPPIDTANALGLTSDRINTSQTFMLKTNLSTVTQHDSAQSFDQDTTDVYEAQLSEAQDFILLLWQCSVTSGSGFYLNYQIEEGANQLPDYLFADGEEATLWLVSLLDSQKQGPGPSSRTLYSFNNCVVVGDNIDGSQATVYTHKQDGMETTRIATLPSGVTVFKVTRDIPSQTPSPQQQTESLYSLLAYQLTTTSDFGASPQGLPAGPYNDISR